MSERKLSHSNYWKQFTVGFYLMWSYVCTRHTHPPLSCDHFTGQRGAKPIVTVVQVFVHFSKCVRGKTRKSRLHGQTLAFTQQVSVKPVVQELSCLQVNNLEGIGETGLCRGTFTLKVIQKSDLYLPCFNTQVLNTSCTVNLILS